MVKLTAYIQVNSNREGIREMAKHYALWPSRYSDCTDPEKLNLMPFVDEEVTNLGESHGAESTG